MKNTISKELIKNLLVCLHFIEKLKCIPRHGWTSTGRQESVADHTWRLAIMVLLSSRHFDREVNLEKALKLALIHDIAEIITGDLPYFLAPEGSDAKKQKKINEELAMMELKSRFGEILGEEIFELWEEYEASETYEAKLIKGLDKIEAQLQQNEADTSTWIECEIKDAQDAYISQFCQFDSFLKAFSEEVIEESKAIIHKTWGTESS